MTLMNDAKMIELVNEYDSSSVKTECALNVELFFKLL